MEEKLNIYQKLARVRKMVEIMKKDSKAYGYTYVREDAILAKITAGMDKYGLSLIPGIVPQSSTVVPYHYVKTKTSKNGEPYEEHVNEILVSADTTWTWVNNENPEEQIVVPWSMVGQQSDASQSFGSGLTYSSRYFLLKYFNVSTSDDDPDNWRSKQKEAEIAEDRIIAEQIIKSFDEVVKSYIGAHQDKTDDVKKLVSKYVKNGNYFAISEPALASKLLNDFNSTFIGGNN